MAPLPVINPLLYIFMPPPPVSVTAPPARGYGPDGAYAGREFLRSTIAVEEEKMHHGHSDEN